MTRALVRSLGAVLATVALLATGCAGSASPPAAATASVPAPVPDTALGLAKGSVFEAPTPPAVTANDTAPGERPVLPRPYVIAPPRIPHGIADFLPITLKDNQCVGCHEVKEKKAGEPTPIPASHYTDYRRAAPDQVSDKLVGARHVCVACHVPTTNAADLVENRFRP